MAYKKKFKKGKPYKTVASLIRDMSEYRWIYWRHKPQHPGWIGSMQFRCVVNAVKSGILYRAVKTETERKAE